MKFRLKHIIVLSLLMLAGLPVSAQTDASQGEDNPVILYSGTSKRYEIADITVTGIEEKNHKTLLKLSGLAVGQRLAVPGPDITQAMKRLWATGLFANVKIRALKISGDKIWLEMFIEQNPKIKEVVFHGVRKGEASELEDKIGMFPGSQITQNGLNRSEKLIRRYFDEKGFKDAEVRVQQRSEPDEDGLAYVEHVRKIGVNSQLLAEYSHTFADKHDFNILAGYEQYSLKNQVFYAENDHLYDPFIAEMSNAVMTGIHQLRLLSLAFFAMLKHGARIRATTQGRTPINTFST